MNKKIFKPVFVMAAATLLVTSCIEETYPESSSATADQVGSSATALEASLNGIPTQMSQWYYVYGEQTHETDMAYLMFPIADTELRDSLKADMPVPIIRQGGFATIFGILMGVGIIIIAAFPLSIGCILLVRYSKKREFRV